MYRGLLEAYFGPQFVLDEELNLEGFRIPHFYRAFYVYKYATGMSAAIALDRAGHLRGGRTELSDYLTFLERRSRQGSVGSAPRRGGRHAAARGPVDTALEYFASWSRNWIRSYNRQFLCRVGRGQRAPPIRFREAGARDRKKEKEEKGKKATDNPVAAAE